ncbi:hypothetical protein ACFLRC_03605 [Candidatus Altiarchaeota archaeon]
MVDYEGWGYTIRFICALFAVLFGCAILLHLLGIEFMLDMLLEGLI